MWQKLGINPRNYTLETLTDAGGGAAGCADFERQFEWFDWRKSKKYEHTFFRLGPFVIRSARRLPPEEGIYLSPIDSSYMVVREGESGVRQVNEWLYFGN